MTTYTSLLRVALQETNDNPNTWGRILNKQVIEPFAQAIAGVGTIDITGSSDVTLTTENGLEDQARHSTLVLTGTVGADINVILPATEKQYFVRGAWIGDHTVSLKISGSSTSVALSTGETRILYTDGTDTYEMLPIVPEIVTGDMEPSFRATPKTGYIFYQGQTLGDTGSGADLEGDAYEALYSFIWNNLANTEAPVSTGRGGTAGADWLAGKTLTIPDLRDRSPFGVGTTWSRIGQTQGVETISKANLPAESLSVTGSTNTTGNHTHPYSEQGANTTTNTGYPFGSGPFGNGTRTNFSSAISSAGNHSHTVTGSTENLGSGSSFLPKGFAVNWMVKL